MNERTYAPMILGTSKASGTTTSTNANKLVDSEANFVTADIAVGDFVLNTTDCTEAKVTSVDSTTQLTLDADIMVSGEAYNIGTNLTRVDIQTMKSIVTKKLIMIPRPQSSANYSSGPRKPKILDLLIMENRYQIIGYIDSIFQTAFENIVQGGGVFNMEFNGINYDVNCDKYELNLIEDKAKQDEMMVQFTVIIGENV